jgi:hypothetical protein
MPKLHLLLILLILPWAAQAGEARYHPTPTVFTIATAECPTGSPGLAPDGIAWGISLSELRGFKATICPEVGQTITGVGSMKICTYSATPWGPGAWALSELEWDMTDVTSTSTHRCRELSQLMPVVSLSDRVFVYPSQDFGVSGGTTLTVYLVGERR